MFTTNAKSSANASSSTSTSSSSGSADQEQVRTESASASASASASVIDLPVDASLNETNKYKNVIYLHSNVNDEINYNMMDKLLENEKQHNKTETWIKLDKTVKIQKLHQFAEKYGKLHALPVKDVKSLKLFFVNCLEKNKLNKTKDVTYNKDSLDITAIPSLHFNQATRNYTLKIVDVKRVSTLKSLTPKRIIAEPSV
jgi:hypothetical protein